MKICTVDGCPEPRPCPVHKPKRSPSSQRSSEPGYKRLRREVLERDDYICHICGHPDAGTADHVIPASDGGENSLVGLKAAHRLCNRRKSNRWQIRRRASQAVS